MKLSEEEKRALQKAAYAECSFLIGDEGDQFKHRNLPEVRDGLEQKADDYFFQCVRVIAKELKAKSK